MMGRALTPAAVGAAVLLCGGQDLRAAQDSRAGGEISTERRAAIDNAVHEQVGKCWTLPKPVYSLAVTLNFQLKSDGSLLAGPTIVAKSHDAPDFAVESAIAAVQNCMPLKLPLDAHAYWRNVTIKFATPQPGRPFGASAWPQ